MPGKNLSNCTTCGGLLENPKWNQKYCISCRVKYRERREAEMLKVNASTKGAINELKVAADLLSKKFDVYRAVSPSAFVDLVVHKNSKLFRVEVTAVTVSIGGTMFYLPHNSNNYDVIALVFPNGDILYKPELSTLFV